MRRCAAALALFLSSCAWAQQTAPVLRGSWIATAGPKQVYRGRWSAQALPNSPNVAQGSWTLANERDQAVLEGTWSARKSSKEWQGTWSARVKNGKPASGTWRAAAEQFKGKTFEELLEQTLEKQVSGFWRSGRAQGNWWLKGAPY
jgi:hypothetical protein